MCSKPAKENWVYCCEDCVKKHVKKALEVLRKNKPKFSSSLSIKSHVLVMEPSSNTLLNPPNAPTESNLETWLLTHPSYHAILPNSDTNSKFYSTSTSKFYGASKNKPKKLETPTKVNSEKIKAVLMGQDAKTVPVKPKPSVSGISASTTPTKVSLESSSASAEKPKITKTSPMPRASIEKSRKVSGTSPKPPIIVHSSAPSSSSKPRSKESSSSRERRESFSGSSPSISGSKTSKSEARPFRDSVIKGLKEALKSKLSKNEDVKLEENKLSELVKNIEHEMYNYYNKDVGVKYKNKYRSLVFNIKDEKNNGLFRKIVNGQIDVKKLVAMSSEDMANKELKEWRQTELKQDIEKIKSHELELLQMGAKMVVKTHKGEEVVSTQDKKADIKLPLEILVDKDAAYKAYKKVRHDRTWDHEKHTKENRNEPKCDVCSGKMTETELKEARVEREKRRAERRKKDHKKSSSSHRSRSRSKDRSKHSKSKEDKKAQEAKIESAKNEVKPEDIEKKVEEILASSGVLTASLKLPLDQPVLPEKEIIKPEVEVIAPAPVLLEEKPKKTIEEVKRSEENSEVTSTVTIKTPDYYPEEIIRNNPTIWSGEINMPDVATFSVTAHQLSGTTDYLTFDLKDTLKIVGRIPPTTVWNYIKQVAESKEILLISLWPNTKDEEMNYKSFFTYLKSRDRFGVVGNNSKMVKDCYIMAISKDENLHSCLLPLDGPGLDENRKDMLVALIVRSKRKRNSDDSSNSVVKKAKKPSGDAITLNDDDINEILEMSEEKTTSYVPTPVEKTKVQVESKRKRKTIEDEDEVYDPEKAFTEGGEPGFSDSESPSPPPGKKPMVFDDQLAKLAKEIEQQKKEISKIEKKEDVPEPSTTAGFKGRYSTLLVP